MEFVKSFTPVRFSNFSQKYFTQVPLVTNFMSGCLAPADIELFIPITQRLVEMNCRFMKLFWAGLWLSLLREKNQIATEFPQIWLVRFGSKKEISKPSNTANHNKPNGWKKWAHQILTPPPSPFPPLLHKCTHSFESICNSRSLPPNFTVLNVSKDKLVPGTPITFQRRRHFWVMPGRGPLCKKDQRTYWTRPLCRYVCFYLPVYWSPQERLNTRDLVKDITGKKCCNSTDI